METREQLSTHETRALRGLEIREAGEGSTHIATLTGYAAVFNSDSVEFRSSKGPWVERISPGAFGRSLREQPDVMAFWAHDTQQPIARAPKSLRLSEDERGLKVEIDLPRTTVARDLLENIRAGVVDAMSFGFRAVAEKWQELKDRDLRTLTDVDLLEVSAVVYPAYPDTTLAVRSHDIFRQGLERPAATPTPARDYWERRLGLR